MSLVELHMLVVDITVTALPNVHEASITITSINILAVPLKRR